MSPQVRPGGRRTAAAPTKRVSPLAVLAVVIPLLTVGALATVRPPEQVSDPRTPAAAPLSRATLVCPSALADAGTVSLASADGTEGEVRVRVQGSEDTVDLAGGTERRGGQAALSLQALDDLAPAVVATRHGRAAATACERPLPEAWFTGVGAGAEHSSVLELVNPDGGPAVADVVVHGPDGVVDVPALRGVAVTGGRSVRLDLAEVVPTVDELSLHVTVTRGRLGAAVVDRLDELGGGDRSAEWLPLQDAPLTTSYLPGLGGKAGSRTLVVTNSGDSEARVGLRLVTDESEFAPTGVEELRVPPGAVSSLDLTRLLGARAARGARAVLLDSSQPVTAVVRTVAGGDLSHAVATAPLASRSAAALPSGPKRLVLTGASAPGVVTWTVWDDAGDRLRQERVEVDPGTAQRISLPGDASLLDLRVERATVVAAVEAGPPGLTVLPLRELAVTSEVADVRPAVR